MAEQLSRLLYGKSPTVVETGLGIEGQHGWKILFIGGVKAGLEGMLIPRKLVKERGA